MSKSNKDILISVVVPIYNVEEYLDKCVTSIVLQSYKNLEIILVNDGSTDGCDEICKNWAKKDKRIVYKKKKNGGLSSARNAGIDVAKGKYICFVDSDDFLEETAIAELYEKLENSKADISICDMLFYFENGDKVYKHNDFNIELIMDSEKAIKKMNSFKTFDMSANAKLYNMRLFETIRFPEGKICEDFYVMYKIFDLSDKIVYFSHPLYYYLQRKGSITKNQKIRYDFIYAAEQQMLFVEDKYPSLKGCVRSAYASANMTVYSQVIKNGGKCPKDVTRNFKQNVRENASFVYKNDDIPFVKKVQTFLFVNCLPIYNLSYRLYKFIKKV